MNPLVEEPIHIDTRGIDDGLLQVPSLHRLQAMARQIQVDAFAIVFFAEHMLQHI